MISANMEEKQEKVVDLSCEMKIWVKLNFFHVKIYHKYDF